MRMESRDEFVDDDDGRGGGGDAELDAMLRGHLGATLDGQLGRSRKAFERHVAAVERAALLEGAADPRRRERRRWTIGAIGVGIAASAALVAGIVTAVIRPNDPPPVAGAKHAGPVLNGVHEVGPKLGTPQLISRTQPAPVMLPLSHFQKVDETFSRYSQDEGLIVIDGHTPARIVREVAVERTEWVDEQRGLTIKAVVPREDVKLISLETH